MSKCPLLLTLAALLTALLMAVGCSSRPSAGMGVLATADSLMESRPDSALRLLRTVDPSELRRGEESARYALLMSMALDKNYIDTTTFDILRPAIDYYLRKGTPDERLRTLYYQGRIYENGANYDKALSTLNQAAATSGYSDSLTMARALFAQGNIYKNYYDINSALESFLEAGKIYNHINRKYLEFDCLLNALNNSIIIRDKQTTDSLVEVCQQFQTLDYDMYCRLQGYLLSYYVNMRDIQELRKFLLRENEHIGYDMDDIVMLASAYNRLGENQKALQLLDSVKKSGKKYDPMKYLATAVFVNRDLGDFKTAFTTYWDFSCKNESLDVKRLDQRTKLIAEKHRVELQSQEYYRQKTFLFWGSLGGILILTLLIFVLLLIAWRNKIQKEKKQLEAELLANRVGSLEEDICNLKRIIEAPDDIPQEIRLAIHSRIEFLNSILTNYITTGGTLADEPDILEKMTGNIDEFMNTTRLAFQTTHPQFIKYFVDHDLTVEEINYVCLFAIGLRAKDVGKYLKKPGHVNLGTVIRRKLNINKDTHLSVYVRNLFKKA